MEITGYFCSFFDDAFTLIGGHDRAMTDELNDRCVISHWESSRLVGETMADTIVLPTDGSTNAQRATAHAIALAKSEDATLHALFVVETRDTGEPALSSMEMLVSEQEDRGREVLSAVAEAAQRHGVQVETTCCHGDPTDTIGEFADEVDADLIVMGERGQTHEHREGTVTRELRRDDDRVVVA